MVTVASRQQSDDTISIGRSPPIIGIVASVTTGDQLNINMTRCTADIIGIRSRVVSRSGIATVATLATVAGLQGRVTGRTVDVLLRRRFMMRCSQLALMTTGAIGKFTNPGVTLDTITTLRGLRIMVSILLTKGMALVTITGSRYLGVTVGTFPRGVKGRLMMTFSDTGTMTLGTPRGRFRQHQTR